MSAGQPDEPTVSTTVDLIDRVRAGRPGARDALVRRYLPLLQRRARGRLPHRARDPADPDDVVQVSLIRALEKVEAFEYRGEGRSRRTSGGSDG